MSVPELAKGPVRTRAGVSLRPCLAPALDAMGRIPSEKVKGLVVYSVLVQPSPGQGVPVASPALPSATSGFHGNTTVDPP